ncbi:hypothetical protein BDR22DRAFT_711067 [Usnea florida]
MCRQFIRYCRDCSELFPLQEPGMRESCETFREAQMSAPYLEKCPDKEIEIIRPASGHGGKVCESCSRKNRNRQREQENARKRARRAKLKRDKMTAGIGAGNVVWTAPNIWGNSVVDAPTLAVHSPTPRRLHMKFMAQASQHGLNGRISTSTMAQNHTKISQEQGCVYSHSGQSYRSTTYHVQQQQEHGQFKNAEETLGSTNLCQESENKLQSLPTPAPDGPACHETKHEPVGLGITLTDDAKWGQSHGEKYSSSDWEREFRDELMKWSTVWDPDDE